MDAHDRRSRGLIPGLRMAGIAVALAVALGACSASTASPSPAGTSTTPSVAPADSSGPASSGPAASGAAEPSSAVCQDLDATKAAITALATIDVKTAGADGVKAAITTVRTSLDTLKASAGAELRRQ